MDDVFVGVLAYADAITVLISTADPMRLMLQICEE